MVTPIAGFDGIQINNVHNMNVNNRTEPLYICVFPFQGNTVVIMFRHEKAKRYRSFERRLREMEEPDILQTVVKLIFTYSEDVFLNKSLDTDVLNDDNLQALAHMDDSYIGVMFSEEELRRNAHAASLQDYALDRLPDPPALLSDSYAIA